jgi:hypothetical protein
MKVLRTAIRAPLMNSICERFIGSARHDCLDHVIVLGRSHMKHVLEHTDRAISIRVALTKGLGKIFPFQVHVRSTVGTPISHRYLSLAGFIMIIK